MINILMIFLAVVGNQSSSKETSKPFVQEQNSSSSDWKKLLSESIDKAKKIQNPQERNKLLELIQSLQQTSEHLLATDTSLDNCFLAEQQRQQWQTLINELSNRISIAQSNLIDSQDKIIILQVLQNLNIEASKRTAVPGKLSEKSDVRTSSLAFFHESKDLYAEAWLEYNLNQVKHLLGSFSPSVSISHSDSLEERLFAERLSDHLNMAGIHTRLGQKKDDDGDEPDFFLVIGSKRYGEHYRQNRQNVELLKIEERYRRKPGHVISILFSDDPMQAFPDYLRNQVFADFTDSDIYHHQLGMVILAVCRHADDSSSIKRTLQTMVEGTYSILNLSEEELSQN